MPREARADRPSAHLVGVCGAGMKALAELLDGLGWQLSGSDLLPASAAITALTLHGLTFSQGHSAANLPKDVQCLVYSPAIRPENPERTEASRRGLPQWSYGEMIGRLMRDRTGICISGTHGKSTTTAMVGWILSVAGRDPAVLVGAELCDSGNSGRAGKGDLLVVESCEFNRSFLDFQPRFAAVLNVEPDHFDCYADLPSLVTAFQEFVQLVSTDGVLLVNGDSRAAHDVAIASPARVVTFGRSIECDWSVGNVHEDVSGISFDIYCGPTNPAGSKNLWGQIQLRLHGEHNVENALAAAALCAEMGISPQSIIAGLGSFGGVKRRFEVVGEADGLLLIDDYAHHPTAVRATLQAARRVYGNRRIWCAFQPHQVSRTLALMDDFAASFDDCDELLVVPVFAARERVTDEPQRVSRELADRVAARGRKARYVESLDQIITTVDDAARPGDVLIAMGAGDIDRIHHERIRRIC